MDEEKSPAEDVADGDSKPTLVNRLKTPAKVLAVLGIITCINLLVWWSANRFSKRQDEHRGLEVTIGQFTYSGDSTADSQLDQVEFGLHIAVLSEVDRRGRQLLDMHEHKVRQSIEELLRKAEDADFADPSLRELKRRIQEAINESVSNRIVGEVIITDYVATRAEAVPSGSEATAVVERPRPVEAVPATASTSG